MLQTLDRWRSRASPTGPAKAARTGSAPARSCQTPPPNTQPPGPRRLATVKPLRSAHSWSLRGALLHRLATAWISELHHDCFAELRAGLSNMNQSYYREAEYWRVRKRALLTSDPFQPFCSSHHRQCVSSGRLRDCAPLRSPSAPTHPNADFGATDVRRAILW